MAIFLFNTLFLDSYPDQIRESKLTTWLIPETFDWRMVTASPIEGFLEALATVEALKARVES